MGATTDPAPDRRQCSGKPFGRPPVTLPARLRFVELPYGSFAFVMATGILSIATGLVGWIWLSQALFALNVAAFPTLLLLLLMRVARNPAAIAGDLADDRQAPAMLTIVAGTCVLGSEIALSGAHRTVAAGFWAAAAILWVGLLYAIAGAMTIRPTKFQIARRIDGAWLLAVVATEALAILTAHMAGSILPSQPAVFASLCLFLLGGAFYLFLLVLIVYRWIFLPMRPQDLGRTYWINMGAAAIAALAGTRLATAVGADAALAPVRGFVFTATVLFWSLASWWIPLLCALTLWRHRNGVSIRYRLENWSMVFPLGMYTTATWRFSHEFGFRFLDIVPEMFVWVALAAWGLNFIGLLRAATRWPAPS